MLSHAGYRFKIDPLIDEKLPPSVSHGLIEFPDDDQPEEPFEVFNKNTIYANHVDKVRKHGDARKLKQL
jgi:hypothetical protein